MFLLNNKDEKRVHNIVERSQIGSLYLFVKFICTPSHYLLYQSSSTETLWYINLYIHTVYNLLQNGELAFIRVISICLK